MSDIFSDGPQAPGPGSGDPERAAFLVDVRAMQEARKKFLPLHQGKFVLIHAGEVIGLYLSEADAFNVWRRDFPDSDVIIEELAEEEPVAYLYNWFVIPPQV